MKKQIIKAYDEMICAQEKYKATKAESDLLLARKKEQEFSFLCEQVPTLPMTEKEIEVEQIKKLESAERSLELALYHTDGKYKSKYKRTGDVENDIRAARRELFAVFDFLAGLDS